MCSNLATNVFLPFFFFLFLFWVAFALMSFILATLQSCFVAVSNQIPSDVCVRGNSPISLCVMYINVAVYGFYVKPEECWYMKTIRARFLQSFLVVRCSLLLCMAVNKDNLWLISFWETRPFWPVRPASVTASPFCMTRPQAGVITLVPSTVRSGISMAQMDGRCTS